MAGEKIKVIMRRVLVVNDADWFGSGEFYFTCKVDGKPVGDKSQIFDAREGRWIHLPEARWSAEVDVAGKPQVTVSFNGKDQDLFFDDDLGTVTYTLRPPWTERDIPLETEYFKLVLGVELRVDGSFGHHAPTDIFACSAAGGTASCTTVSGVPVIARFEIHPVRPVPSPPPANALPPRGLPPGPSLAQENALGTVITPADPINIVPNPSVIPILTAPGGPAPAAGAPPVADATNCARIEVTYYRPNTLAFTNNDPRLEWTSRALAGGSVAFLGPAQGLKVMIYGTAAGEVLLELRFRGEIVATYRALVMAVKPIRCRFNILNGPVGSRPRTTPANVLDHLLIANRYLRQLALELVLDTDPHRSNGATATGTPGIFRISVAKGITWHVNDGNPNLPATRLNYRPDVMNFAYIHSTNSPTVGGAASDFPDSNLAPAAPGARPRITDSGTPSTSWISPTGIPPDTAAGAVGMDLIKGIQRAGHPRLFAMFLCDRILGNPAVLADQQLFAKSICHELGHILNLGHRIEGPDPATTTGLVANGVFFDGLRHPPNQNVMFWQGVQDICQDFDIIQVRAVHQSKLVPP